jgi:hypothetical protein
VALSMAPEIWMMSLQSCSKYEAKLFRSSEEAYIIAGAVLGNVDLHTGSA